MNESIPTSQLRPQAKREELSRLLALAEEIEQRADRFTARSMTYGIVSFAYALACGVAFYFVLVKALTTRADIATAIAAAVTAVTAGFMFIQVQKLRRRKEGEIRALREVLEVLREVESAVAREQGWSAVERAEFRIRLSRFSIGGRR